MFEETDAGYVATKLTVKHIIVSVVLTTIVVGSVGTVAGMSVEQPTPDGSVQTGVAESVTVEEGTLTATHNVSLLPSKSGIVRDELTVQIPENVQSLSISIIDDHTVISKDGLTQTQVDESTYNWDGQSNTVAITYEVQVNRSRSEYDGLQSVATSSWAFFGNETLAGLTYGYNGEVNREEAYNSARGIYHDSYIFLGDHQTATFDADKSTTVVVNEALTPQPDPGRIQNKIQYLHERYPVGDGTDKITAFFVGPPLRGGGAARSNVFWVGDDSTRGALTPTLSHEYYHTQQTGRYEERTEWLSEATAEYYSHHSDYLTGRFDGVELAIAHNTNGNYQNAVLADRSTWRGTYANYQKGAHVLAALDLQIRDNTGGEQTIRPVLRELNQRDGVDYKEFKQVVISVGGESLGPWLDRYVTTTDTPPLPENMTPALGNPERNTPPEISRAGAIEVTAGETAEIGISEILETGDDTPVTELDIIDVDSSDRPGTFHIVDGETLQYTLSEDASGQFVTTISVATPNGAQRFVAPTVSIKPGDKEPQPPLAARFDDDEDNEVDASEVLQLISAYNRDGDIEAEQVLRVISLYNTEQPWGALG